MKIEEIFHLSEWLGLWVGIITSGIAGLMLLFHGPFLIFSSIAAGAWIFTGISMIHRGTPIKKEKPE